MSIVTTELFAIFLYDGLKQYGNDDGEAVSDLDSSIFSYTKRCLFMHFGLCIFALAVYVFFL